MTMSYESFPFNWESKVEIFRRFPDARLIADFRLGPNIWIWLVKIDGRGFQQRFKSALSPEVSIF